MKENNTWQLTGTEDLSTEIGRFLQHLGKWKYPIFFFEKAWKPLCDVCESEDEVVVTVELAGIKMEHLNIAVENNQLLVEGFREESISLSSRNYHVMEISYGAFERYIPLPAKVDAERATAKYNDGLLEIRLPKAKKEPKREVEIDIRQREG